ncbi:MAG TPA: hypothetical protein VEQ85_00795, partial [Lacipirellulaceae bacterium]|nr:hypothetical protein [Lacipirellulaceae bacterium]
MQGALTDPTFKPLLAPFEPLLLESQGVCAYGLWSDLRLAYFSPGWFEFSAANGGEPDLSARWTLGTDLLSAIQGPLRPMFRAGYVRALAECRPWEHLYECSSAEQFRTFQMMAYPLANSAGLLVVHSLLVERPHPADPS